MLDLDRFFADCRDAVAQDVSHKGVREVVARAVREPGAVIAALGEPRRAGIDILFRSPNLTILNVIWGPGMTIMPHDHRMWAVIGIYTGREDNIFWRRLPADANRLIEAAGGVFAWGPRLHAAGSRHHPLGDEPDPPPDRRHPRLWRGLPRAGTQRVGRRDAARAPLRHGEGAAVVRGFQQGAAAGLERDRPDWNTFVWSNCHVWSEAVAGLDPVKRSGAECAPSSRLLPPAFARGRNDSGDHRTSLRKRQTSDAGVTGPPVGPPATGRDSPVPYLIQRNPQRR